MSDFISPILQWINTHPEFAGLATFIISAAESVAIIGTIVPGTVMMTTIGTLIGSGVMPFWSTILWTILGAIVGDGISYWMGYYFKDRLRDMWPFRNYPALLDTGIRFFKKHGGKSVFIGRFVGPVRALVPLVAGMLHMKPLKFTISNVASAIGWAPAYLLPGIALGAASLELPPDIAVHAILMLLLVGLFIIFCLWFIQKLLRLISKQINSALTRIWQRLQTSRHFSLITTALQHHNPYKTYGQLTLAFYLILTCILFIYLAVYIKTHGSENLFINDAFLHLFRSLRTPLGDAVMVSITLLGDTKVMLSLIVTLFAWFAWTKHWRTAWHVLALGILTTISIETFKHIIHSPRPWGVENPPSTLSFPSGHTTYATAFFLGIALLLIKTYKHHSRRFFYTLAGIIIAAIGMSRFYLGVHWFTDVLGGILLGAIILMLIVLSYNRQEEKVIKPFGVITTILLTLLISYSLIFSLQYSRLKQNTRLLDWPVYSVSLDAWWKQQDDHLPLYRINRFGLATQILNLQWLGDLDTIKKHLLQNGWETPEKRDWITALHRISDVQSAEHLPLVSPLYLDKDPALVLIKHPQGKRKLIVLRFWDSHTRIINNKYPLWVGTVEIVPRTYSWLFKHTRSTELSLSPDLLFATTPPGSAIKVISVTNYHRRKPEKQNMVLIKPKNS